MPDKNPLHAILNAKSIAFFGASNRPTTMGTTQILHLLRGGFDGKVWPMHPTEKTVLGVPAYKSLADFPEVPELAVLVLPTRIVPDILDECGKKGIKYAVVISGGFKETGEEGKMLEGKVKEVAARHGIRFIGPNCIGVINAQRSMNFTFFPYTLGPGTMGMLSQSGTYVTQVIPHLERLGMCYSKAISLGNEADIDIIDGLEYMSEDSDTKAIALYIEGIRRGRKFIEVAKRVSMKKPIVAYYVGGTEAGARSGASHTGAMGGDDLIHDAVFRQCGIIRAPTIQDLYDWAWALANVPLPKGRRVAIISHSGGPVTSMADACSRYGFQVPILSDETRSKIEHLVPRTGSTANPVDLTFSMNPTVMTSTLPMAIAQSGEVDTVLVHGLMGSSFIREMSKAAPDLVKVPYEQEQMLKFMELAHQGIIELVHEKDFTVLTSSFSDRSDQAVDCVMRNRIPLYPSPERAVAALAALIRYAEWRKDRE